MKAPSANITREERLAAKLRENLRRRKAQTRGLNEAARPSSAPEPRETQDAQEAQNKSEAQDV